MPNDGRGAEGGHATNGHGVARDLSEREFGRRLEAHGMRLALMGYVRVTEDVSIYRYNAGPRRRDQLAYLIREQERAKARAKERASRRTEEATP